MGVSSWYSVSTCVSTSRRKAPNAMASSTARRWVPTVMVMFSTLFSSTAACNEMHDQLTSIIVALCIYAAWTGNDWRMVEA